MSQPDQVSTSFVEAAPSFWSEPVEALVESRVSELHGRRLPSGTGFGRPGPDQGYALTLFNQIEESLVLVAGEHHDDIREGVIASALALAAEAGRGPSLPDLQRVLAHYRLQGDAGSEDIRKRKQRFTGVAHDYAKRRSAADQLVAELATES